MRAAAAVKQEILRRNSTADVVILDTFRYASPFIEKLVLGTYMEIIKMSPVIYGYFYRQAEKEKPISGFAKNEFNRIINRLAAPKLTAFIDQMQPEAIVCTHPFPLGILTHLRSIGACNMPILAAITDFTVHPFWLFEEVDCYLVGADLLVQEFNNHGVELRRVRATGIPIDSKFGKAKERKSLREVWGLQEGLPAILVMGGGLGMGPLGEVVSDLISSGLHCQVVVVCGKNEGLRSKLLKLQTGSNCQLTVLGYTNNIPDLMAACDVMIGKAGGLTSAESMASGLPMLITNPIPGQEERNAAFLESVGAAKLVPDPKNLVLEVGNFINDHQLQVRMRKSAQGVGKPRSAELAVDVIEELVENYTKNDIQLLS